MSTSALHANAFFEEIRTNNGVWTVRDSDGYPAPLSADGHRSQPFWSSEHRAQLTTAKSKAYKEFEIVHIRLDVWRNEWLVDLESDEIRVGINWSGASAVGYDLTVGEVLARLGAIDI